MTIEQYPHLSISTWFDSFHAEHPTIPIGCSEYGAEALDWHNSAPYQGDYSEEYQAHYHEELTKEQLLRWNKALNQIPLIK